MPYQEKFHLIIFSMFLCLLSSCVSSMRVDTEQIKDIRHIPYIENCTDVLFWSLVNRKDNIPELIDRLEDDTPLRGVYVPNFGGEYTVGDVAFIILKEKIEGFPILSVPIDYWNFVRSGERCRSVLRNRVADWYERNKDRLVWGAAKHSLTGDCSSSLLKGRYQIR